jgi:hypothetical protein
MSEYRWKPIEPLSDAERSIDLADIQPTGIGESASACSSLGGPGESATCPLTPIERRQFDLGVPAMCLTLPLIGK